MGTIASPAETAALTPYGGLVDALRFAVEEVARGCILSPPRQVVSLPGRPEGEERGAQHGACPISLPGGAALLSMVATAADISVHKLVTVVPGNAARGLPTIQGQVQVLDTTTGSILMTLDGATVTGRRTAAMSMLGIRILRGARPATVLVIGTGTQARHHIEALHALYRDARLEVIGRSPGAAERFCDELALRGLPARAIAKVCESRADVVITCTTSHEPVYAMAASSERLLTAVGSFTPGAAEIAVDTVRASHLVVDDPFGARHEAGDLIRAGVDWHDVHALADKLGTDGPQGVPILFKTVGCAAWDLAAARVALGEANGASA